MSKLRVFDSANYLKTEEDVKVFLEDALETKDSKYISSAMEVVRNISGENGEPKFVILPFFEYQALLAKTVDDK